MAKALVADRVKEKSTSIGTGSLALSGPYIGYQTFVRGVGSGSATFYAIVNEENNEWETGWGYVGASTLIRNTVYESSASGSFVNFSAGVKSVFIPSPASRTVLFPLDSLNLHVSSSLIVSGTTQATAVTASLGFKGDGSQVTGVLTSSYATLVPAGGVIPGTMSGDFFINGNITIPGTASVGVLTTVYTTSSVIFSSGSTIWGNSMDDTHLVTGSLLITGSTTMTGPLTVNSGSTGVTTLKTIGGYGVVGVGNVPSTLATMTGMYGFSGDTNLYFNAQTGGVNRFSVNGSTLVDIAATGMFTNVPIVFAPSTGLVLSNVQTTTTASISLKLQGTGKTMILGVESNTGASLASNTNANAVVLANTANSPLDFVTNNSRRGGFSNAGLFDVTNGFTVTGSVNVGGTAGSTPFLTIQGGVGGDYVAKFTNSRTTPNAYGLYVQGGTGAGDYALRVVSGSGATELFSVRGDGVTQASYLFQASAGIRLGDNTTISTSGGYFILNPATDLYLRPGGTGLLYLGDASNAGVQIGAGATTTTLRSANTVASGSLTVTSTANPGVEVKMNADAVNIFEKWTNTGTSGKYWMWQIVGGSNTLVLSSQDKSNILQVDPTFGTLGIGVSPFSVARIAAKGQSNDSSGYVLYMLDSGSTERFTVFNNGATVINTTTTSQWALQVQNAGVTNGHGLYVNTNSAGTGTPLRVDRSGNPIFTVNSTGTVYTATTAQDALVIQSGNSGGAYMEMYDTSTGLARGFVGYGATLFSGATGSDFGIRSENRLIFSRLGSIQGLFDSVGLTLNVPLTSISSGYFGSGYTFTQSTPSLSGRAAGSGNAFEFGHGNSLGYGSNIGHETATGKPFLAFYSEAGTTANTYRTRGIRAQIIRAGSSQLEIGTLSSINADNQTFSPLWAFDVSSGAFVVGTDPGGAATVRVGGSGYFSSTLSLSVSSGNNMVLEKSTGGFIQFQRSGVNNAGFGAANGDGLQFYYGSSNTLAGQINSSGAWILGTDPGGTQTLRVGGHALASRYYSNANSDYFLLANSATTGWAMGRIVNNSGDFNFGVAGAAGAGVFTGATAYATTIGNISATYLQFFTSNTYRGQITPTGEWVFGTDPGGSELVRIGGSMRALAAGVQHTIQNSFSGGFTMGLANLASTSPNGLVVNFGNAAPNSTSNYFLVCSDNAANRILGYSNGGIANFQANNVNLSDERVKMMGDVIDGQVAADLFGHLGTKGVWRNFKYKDQTHEDWNIGFGLQSLDAAISEKEEFVQFVPSLINKEDGWGEKDEQKLWSVYETDLTHLSFAAISNLVNRVVELEKRLAKYESGSVAN